MTMIPWLSSRRPALVAPRRPRLDLGSADPDFPLYAIGDVHGRLDLLQEAERKIADDIAANGQAGCVILLGDYVDRGPDPAGVLDYLSRPGSLGLRRILLRGNHEDMFLRFLTERSGRDWLQMGGSETLMSYGINPRLYGLRTPSDLAAFHEVVRAAVPPAHVKLLASMPVSLRIGRMVFVHAGLRPGIALDQQDDHDLLWIREPFLSEGPALPWLVVHGHTPSKAPSFGPQRVGIDTGAYQTGRLTVLKLSSGRLAFL